MHTFSIFIRVTLYIRPLNNLYFIIYITFIACAYHLIIIMDNITSQARVSLYIFLFFINNLCVKKRQLHPEREKSTFIPTYFIYYMR